MKNLIHLLSISFFLILFSISLSAQRKSKIQLIGGANFNSEYLYNNQTGNKISTIVGVFGKVKFNKRFSTATSLNYGQRNFSVSRNSSLAWCGNGLTEEFMAYLTNGYREKSWTIEQLIKLHFNGKKTSYFFGAGLLLRIPTLVQSLPSESETFIASPSSTYLERENGIQFATGVDYYCFKNILFSAQINWNIYNSNYLFDNNYIHSSMFNPNNISLSIGLGYIFNQ